MIKRLQNKELEIATKIRSVFQDSYAVEAKLLNAIDFPPLKRPLDSFLNSTTEFFGFWDQQELAAVIEIDHHKNYTHINSLVVAPKFFRQGIAQKLMEFVLNTYNSNLFTVETGVKNGPATALYKKFNFTEIKQWETDHGVRKIRFELLKSI